MEAPSQMMSNFPEILREPEAQKANDIGSFVGFALHLHEQTPIVLMAPITER